MGMVGDGIDTQEDVEKVGFAWCREPVHQDDLNVRRHRRLLRPLASTLSRLVR